MKTIVIDCAELIEMCIRDSIGGETMDKIYHGRDVLKRQIAEELGYAEKIRNSGWGELTSVEAGRIGGLVTGYMKKHNW